MKFLRSLPTRTRRDAWVEVNLGVIEENARTLRGLIPPATDLMAIVKADAYGHGAVMITPTLEASGFSMLGVASLDEAFQIRDAGLGIPILVIGAVPDWSLDRVADEEIQLTVFDPRHLENLKQAYALNKKPIKAHVKVDTGMNRIGVPFGQDGEQAAAFIRQCHEAEFVQLEGIFTHLAWTANRALTQAQLDRWHGLLDELESEMPLPRYLHVANSGGVLNYPEARGNLARIGIALYGYGEGAADAGVRPAMGLKARIIALNDIPPETGVSYNHVWSSTRTSRIATIPVGYADGVPRVLSGKIEALFKGRRIPQVGSITMDQMMLDVTDAPDAAIGETITMIGSENTGGENGERITLSDWAEKAGTIEYELMAALRVRLPKTYTR